ncbi:hypothetical protein JZ751_013172 [Albula glossodonta]|uniref:Uncharacterized protein n=1 Tax=Albula glossodonta TaxID=121402 RepID=A0A8T2NXE5_9TELE|nr:hypothetical protein JZ751_013172 [Albula glossodonta]
MMSSLICPSSRALPLRIIGRFSHCRAAKLYAFFCGTSRLLSGRESPKSVWRPGSAVAMEALCFSPALLLHPK